MRQIELSEGKYYCYLYLFRTNKERVKAFSNINKSNVTTSKFEGVVISENKHLKRRLFEVNYEDGDTEEHLFIVAEDYNHLIAQTAGYELSFFQLKEGLWSGDEVNWLMSRLRTVNGKEKL